MHPHLKRHQEVKLLIEPDAEYIEYSPDFENIQIKKGMKGKINLILPNGQYHVEIFNEKGETIAYVKMDEESLEAD